eukprot:6396964-Prymnesium_polylepis.1
MQQTKALKRCKLVRNRRPRCKATVRGAAEEVQRRRCSGGGAAEEVQRRRCSGRGAAEEVQRRHQGGKCK